MDISKIRLFIETVNRKSLTKAADKLGYSQSAASYILKSLEKELNVPLLNKTHVGTTLTKEGERVLPLFQEIVALEDKVLSITASDMSTLRVAAFASVCSSWLPQIISRYNQSHPGISVNLFSYSGGNKAILEGIKNRAFDCAFFTDALDTDLEYKKIYTDKRVLILPAKDPLTELDSIPLYALKDHPLILPGDRGSLNEWFQEQEFSPLVKAELNDLMPAFNMVASGMGYAIVPSTILSACPPTCVAKPLIVAPGQIIYIGKQKGTSTESVKAFINATKRYIDSLSCLSD